MSADCRPKCWTREAKSKLKTSHKNVKRSKYLQSRNLKYSLLGNPTPPPPHTYIHTHTHHITVMDNMTRDNSDKVYRHTPDDEGRGDK